MKNLSLIGFSGAGKSHIGKALSDRLGLTFVDLDAVMEEEQGIKLAEILEALGDERFVAYEADVVKRRTTDADRHLISTGGSVVYSPDAMAHLSAVSAVVYLDVPYETIEKRLRGSAERLGRIVGLGGKTLRELYDSRTPLYERYAHARIAPESLGLEGAIARITEFYERAL